MEDTPFACGGLRAELVPSSAQDKPKPSDLVQIGEVADRAGLSLRTVRYYEELGLVSPQTRTEGGFRLYSDAQVDRLLLIKRMKPLGFSVQEMREVLDARETLRRDEADEAAREAAGSTEPVRRG